MASGMAAGAERDEVRGVVGAGGGAGDEVMHMEVLGFATFDAVVAVACEDDPPRGLPERFFIWCTNDATDHDARLPLSLTLCARYCLPV
jgi:hypothetical protein